MEVPVPNVNINPADLETCACECGCKTWIQAMVIKRASKILLCEDEDKYMNIPIAACFKCGTVMPNQLDFEI